VILGTPAECEVKTKDDFDLLHRNGLSLIGLPHTHYLSSI